MGAPTSMPQTQPQAYPKRGADAHEAPQTQVAKAEAEAEAELAPESGLEPELGPELEPEPEPEPRQLPPVQPPASQRRFSHLQRSAPNVLRKHPSWIVEPATVAQLAQNWTGASAAVNSKSWFANRNEVTSMLEERTSANQRHILGKKRLSAHRLRQRHDHSSRVRRLQPRIHGSNPKSVTISGWYPPQLQVDAHAHWQ